MYSTGFRFMPVDVGLNGRVEFISMQECGAAREEAWTQGFSDDTSSFPSISTVDTSGDIAYTKREIERIWEELISGSS